MFFKHSNFGIIKNKFFADIFKISEGFDANGVFVINMLCLKYIDNR